MSDETDGQGDLGDDLMALGARDQGSDSTQIIRWRDFSVVRWIGLALLLAGASVLFSSVWWVGIVIGFAGLLVLWKDNAKVRRLRDQHDR